MHDDVSLRRRLTRATRRWTPDSDIVTSSRAFDMASRAWYWRAFQDAKAVITPAARCSPARCHFALTTGSTGGAHHQFPSCRQYRRHIIRHARPHSRCRRPRRQQPHEGMHFRHAATATHFTSDSFSAAPNFQRSAAALMKAQAR